MKRLALLVTLLALAAAPALAETYIDGTDSGNETVVTPETEEAHRIWTRAKRHRRERNATPRPDAVEFSVGVPREIDDATFVEALFVLADESGAHPDPGSDPFTGAHARLQAVPCGSGMLELSVSCATQWLDRAFVIVRYDPEFEEHGRGAYFYASDTDRYILPLDRYAADRAWQQQCDAIQAAVGTKDARKLLSSTWRLADPDDVSGADTAHRIGKLVGRLEALRAAAASSDAVFREALETLQRRCRSFIADEDLQAASDELARGILPAGVYTNAELALEFQILRGEALILRDLSPDRSRETLDIPAQFGGRPVTTLCINSFADCRKLRSVVIPPTVRKLLYAFPRCTSLTNAVVGSGVEELYGAPFDDCTALESVEIGAAFPCASGWTFPADAPRLRLRLDPANPRFKLVDGALCSADGKTLLFSPASRGLSVPPGVERIGEGAFSSIPAAEPRLVVPDGVERIDFDAFSRSTGLREAVLPDSVREIESYAFQECPDLESVVIGAGVTNIGRSAFSQCPALVSVRIAATNATMSANAFRTIEGKAPVVFEVGGVPSQPPAYKPDDEDEEIDE